MADETFQMEKINLLNYPEALLVAYAMEIVADAYSKGKITYETYVKAIEKMQDHRERLSNAHRWFLPPQGEYG